MVTARPPLSVSVVQKFAAIVLAGVFLLSAVMSGSLALGWRDFEQHKTNPLEGVYQPREDADGELRVSKTVANADGSELAGAQLELEFEFTVTLQGLPDGLVVVQIDEEEHEFELAGSKLEFTLRHGQVATIRGLPIGTMYEAREAPVMHYITQSSNHQGHIPWGGVTAAFVNTYAPPRQSPESEIIVRKEVRGDGADLIKKFVFTAEINGETHKFELAHGEEKNFSHIPGTSYAITEEEPGEGWVAALRRFAGVFPPEGETLALTFINIYRPGEDGTGDLEVRKAVACETPDLEAEFEFTVTFESGEPQHFTLKHGESRRFENLPHGTGFAVVEHPKNGYIAGVARIDGTIVGGETAVAGFVNYPDEGSLVVEKAVTGEVPGKDRDLKFQFVLELEGRAPVEFELAASESRRFFVPPGLGYAVREVNLAEGWFLAGVTNGTGTTTRGVIESRFTNVYNRVWIDIEGEKTWDMSAALPGTPLPGSITVQLLDGESVVRTTVVRPGEAGRWRYSFNVPKYRDDHETEIIYTVRELPVPGYRSEIEGFDIVNTWVGGDDFVDISVRKVWDDGGHPARPLSVRVQLYRGGIAYGAPETLSAANDWQHSWTALERDFTWTVDEIEVPAGYVKIITGDAQGGFVITNRRAAEPPATTTTAPPTTTTQPSVPTETATTTTTTPSTPATTQYPTVPSVSSAPTSGPGVPQTDDGSNIALWIALMGMSFAGLVGTVLWGKKWGAGINNRYRARH